MPTAKVLPRCVARPLHGAVSAALSISLDCAAVGEKIDPDDLIGAAEVQTILRLSHPSSVTTYLKRYPDFPQPVVDRSDSRIRLWDRQDIVRWHEQRERERHP